MILGFFGNRTVRHIEYSSNLFTYNGQTVTPIPTQTPFPTIGEGPFPFPVPTPTSTLPVPATPVPAITPTVPGATATPTATGQFAPEPVVVPPGAQNIVVQSQLEYGFFSGTQIRQPTKAEYNGLLNETSKFYEGVLKAAFPSLIGFKASFVGQQFRPTNTQLPVLVQFNANAFFPIGDTSVPTQADIFKAMQNANYQGKSLVVLITDDEEDKWLNAHLCLRVWYRLYHEFCVEFQAFRNYLLQCSTCCIQCPSQSINFAGS